MNYFFYSVDSVQIRQKVVNVLRENICSVQCTYIYSNRHRKGKGGKGRTCHIVRAMKERKAGSNAGKRERDLADLKSGNISILRSNQYRNKNFGLRSTSHGL